MVNRNIDMPLEVLLDVIGSSAWIGDSNGCITCVDLTDFQTRYIILKSLGKPVKGDFADLHESTLVSVSGIPTKADNGTVYRLDSGALCVFTISERLWSVDEKAWCRINEIDKEEPPFLIWPSI